MVSHKKIKWGFSADTISLRSIRQAQNERTVFCRPRWGSGILRIDLWAVFVFSEDGPFPLSGQQHKGLSGKTNLIFFDNSFFYYPAEKKGEKPKGKARVPDELCQIVSEIKCLG